MKFLSFLLILLILAPQGAGPAPAPVAAASLDVSASEGVISGTFRLRFIEPVRLYYPQRFGLAPTTNRWFLVEFESESASFHLRAAGAVPKWPHEDGVRTFKPGEQLSVSLETGSGAPYRLYSQAGEREERLPSGTYRVTAKLKVPDSFPARRLGLTSFDVSADPVELVVESGSGKEGGGS